jgi:hypothetical protein
MFVKSSIYDNYFEPSNVFLLDNLNILLHTHTHTHTHRASRARQLTKNTITAQKETVNSSKKTQRHIRNKHIRRFLLYYIATVVIRESIEIRYANVLFFQRKTGKNIQFFITNLLLMSIL